MNWTEEEKDAKIKEFGMIIEKYYNRIQQMADVCEAAKDLIESGKESLEKSNEDYYFVEIPVHKYVMLQQAIDKLDKEKKWR